MTKGVEVIIGADTSQLDDAVGGSKESLVGLSDRMKSTIVSAAKLGAAATAAGAAIAAALTVKGLRSVDAQAKLARRLDATADGLRAVQIAASNAGVDFEVFNDAADNLNERIGEAQTGAGIAAEALTFLGLEASKLEKMDVDERFLVIAERLKEMNATTAQASFLLAELGIEEKRIINLMMDGGEAIRSAREEIQAYGLSLTEIDAAKVEIANKSFATIGRVVDGLAQKMAVEMAPIIAVVSELFLDLAKNGKQAGEDIADGLNESNSSAYTVLSALNAISQFFDLLGATGSWAADRIKLGFLSFADSIANEPVDALNGLIELLNKILGIDIEKSNLSRVGESIRESMQETMIGMADSSTDLQKAFERMSQPFEESEISRKLKSFEERVKESVQEISSATSKIDLTGLGQTGENGDTEGGGANNEQRPEENLKEQLERRLQMIRESNMSERELMLQKFQQENEDLLLSFENKLIAQQEYERLILEQSKRFEEELTRIEKAEADKRKRDTNKEVSEKEKAYSDFYSNIEGLLGKNSKEMFKINKARALSEGAMDAHEAVMGAYKVGAKIGGPPVGAAFAVAAGAFQFAKLKQIASQQYSGGTSGGGGAGGGVAAASQSPQQQSGPAGGTLTVQGLTAGSLLTGDAVAGLANELLEYQRRGGTVVLAT